ncbi:MAG: hypothetical protein QG602_1472 [Verrucomicrobiota bacterium]|nr:hypothetical protein [Verrucomicrobiota bacterium]
METPFQTATRLLTALDELVREEITLIRTMDFVEAVGIRERTGPLVEKLCSLAEDPAVAALQPRVRVLLDRWSQNHHFLETQLVRLQAELGRVNEARGRLRRVVPAYLRPGFAAESRLNTAA